MKFFVSGTDTDIGKTVATGWLARRYAARGLSATTQKLVQTGCRGVSIDILEHRRIMGAPLTPFDESALTCRYVMGYPASPHIVAKMEGVKLDFDALARDTAELEKSFDVVLVEGAGGLMVPLEGDFLTIDYIKKYDLPLWLVAPSKLGSLNHALLSLEAVRARGIGLAGVVYNTYPPAPPEIENSTREFLAARLKKYFPEAELLDMGKVQ
ncbi:MAG: ATP-dependent dethiobiotin synthetase BioD [Opitutales bacterium]|nr:ATP-dependent dethiobiotin synthetase BioD [Opitutales bacterium]